MYNISLLLAVLALAQLFAPISVWGCSFRQPTANDASVQYQYIDRVGFEEILEIGMGDLVDSYFVELSHDMSRIRTLVQQERWNDIGQIAHSQIGASGVMGASSIADIFHIIKDRFRGRRNEATDIIFMEKYLQLLEDSIEPTKLEFLQASETHKAKSEAMDPA